MAYFERPGQTHRSFHYDTERHEHRDLYMTRYFSVWGEYRLYYRENGRLKMEGLYDAGSNKRKGQWKFYDSTGRFSLVADYDLQQVVFQERGHYPAKRMLDSARQKADGFLKQYLGKAAFDQYIKFDLDSYAWQADREDKSWPGLLADDPGTITGVVLIYKLQLTPGHHQSLNVFYHVQKDSFSLDEYDSKTLTDHLNFQRSPWKYHIVAARPKVDSIIANLKMPKENLWFMASERAWRCHDDKKGVTIFYRDSNATVLEIKEYEMRKVMPAAANGPCYYHDRYAKAAGNPKPLKPGYKRVLLEACTMDVPGEYISFRHMYAAPSLYGPYRNYHYIANKNDSMRIRYHPEHHGWCGTGRMEEEAAKQRKIKEQLELTPKTVQQKVSKFEAALTKKQFQGRSMGLSILKSLSCSGYEILFTLSSDCRSHVEIFMPDVEEAGIDEYLNLFRTIYFFEDVF